MYTSCSFSSSVAVKSNVVRYCVRCTGCQVMKVVMSLSVCQVLSRCKVRCRAAVIGYLLVKKEGRHCYPEDNRRRSQVWTARDGTVGPDKAGRYGCRHALLLRIRRDGTATIGSGDGNIYNFSGNDVTVAAKVLL